MALNNIFVDSQNQENAIAASSPTPTASTPRSSPSVRPFSIPTKQNLNGRDRHDSPSPSELDASFNSPQLPSHTSTPTSERNPAWSSAVGKATMGGKSGRVIERLMTENDRLLREKKLATVQLEEELKRGDSARSALESLQISNENLISMHESDVSLLSKRDRRMQELRDELKSEIGRREKAEADRRDLRAERDKTVEKIRMEAMEDRERTRWATSQYEMLSRSWKSLENQYERQMESLKADLLAIRKDLVGDKEKLVKLEVITEQLYKEAEKSWKAKERIWHDFEDYKREQENGIRDMKESAALNGEALKHAQHEMENVLGLMRHVVNVKRDVKGAE